jgi:hypothetical protein
MARRRAGRCRDGNLDELARQYPAIAAELRAIAASVQTA